MPKVTQEIKDKVKAEVKAAHPDFVLHILRNPAVPDGGGDAIARSPNREEWRMFKQKLATEAEKATAHEVLLHCIVWPDRAERDQMFEAYPALPEVWAGELVEIAGSSRAASHEKL